MSHLRLVKPGPQAATALTYENRMGDRYYLHEGKTKTGKPRYFFARTIREGALARMPEGFEVTETTPRPARRPRHGSDGHLPRPARVLRACSTNA